MNVQLKIKTPLADRVMALMSDNRERTINDVRLRLGIPEDQARMVLASLTGKAQLVSKRHNHGQVNMLIWRKP